METADITFIPVLTFPLCCQVAVTFPVNMRCHALPVFTSGIYFTLFFINFGPSQRIYNIRNKSRCSYNKMRIYYILSSSCGIINTIKSSALTIFLKDGQVKLISA